jgi:hypothetical protein
MRRVRFQKWVCTIEKSHYDNGRVALTLYQKDEMIADATVNIPAVKLGPNEVCIREERGYEGMVQALVDAGAVISLGRTVKSGFVDYPVCELQGSLRERGR